MKWHSALVTQVLLAHITSPDGLWNGLAVRHLIAFPLADRQSRVEAEALPLQPSSNPFTIKVCSPFFEFKSLIFYLNLCF